MRREYDARLVDELRKRSYQIVEQDVPITVKPVPDDPRRDVLDPRVLANAMKSAGASSQNRPPSWTSLLGVRRRPLKADNEMVSTEIVDKEFLIGAGDHKINLYSWERADRHRPSSAFIYIHGGGFTAGDVTQYRRALAFVAEQSDSLVVFPEYRLAPEAPFPLAIEDCMACVVYLIEHAEELGIDISRIVIGGDSAGGSLANACIQRMPQDTFAAAVELYPFVDGSPEDPSWSYDAYPVIPEHEEIARGRVDRLRSAFGVVGQMYEHEEGDLLHPWVSAALADEEVLAKFPPTTIMAAEYDYLRIQDEKFVGQLLRAGVDARAIRYGGCDHGFFEWPGIRPQTEEAALTIADIIRETAHSK